MSRVEFAEKVLFTLMVVFLVLTIAAFLLAAISSISAWLR